MKHEHVDSHIIFVRSRLSTFTCEHKKKPTELTEKRNCANQIFYDSSQAWFIVGVKHSDESILISHALL